MKFKYFKSYCFKQNKTIECFKEVLNKVLKFSHTKARLPLCMFSNPLSINTRAWSRGQAGSFVGRNMRQGVGSNPSIKKKKKEKKLKLIFLIYAIGLSMKRGLQISCFLLHYLNIDGVINVLVKINSEPFKYTLCTL